MTSEFKRTMKLMWGHSRKTRSACGCSLLFIGLFCVLVYVGEWLFVGSLDFRYRPDRVMNGYDYGIGSCTMFLLASLNGNVKMVLGNMGKWLFGSKLGRSVIVKGLLVNRLVIFGLMFLPCLVSRIVIICLGYTEYARLGLFFRFGERYTYFPVLVVFAALPLFEMVSGIDLKFFGGKYQMAAAFGSIVLSEAMMTQSVYGWYGNVGRGFGEINMSVGWAIFWHLVLVIAGSFVYYRFMSARYRARSTVSSTEWDATKQ